MPSAEQREESRSKDRPLHTWSVAVVAESMGDAMATDQEEGRSIKVMVLGC